MLQTLPLLGTFGLMTFLAYDQVSVELALFVGGMALGAALRQGALAWRAQQVMPTLLLVVDWSKVDQLLGESSLPSTGKGG